MDNHARKAMIALYEWAVQADEKLAWEFGPPFPLDTEYKLPEEIQNAKEALFNAS